LLDDLLELLVTYHARNSIVNGFHVPRRKVAGAPQVDVLEAHLREDLATAKDQIILWGRGDAGRQGLALNALVAVPRRSPIVPVFRFRPGITWMRIGYGPYLSSYSDIYPPF
jgi:hypothetical protein